MRDARLINIVANNVSDLIPDCCGVTLGGSRCHDLEDEHSDVEMYFYTHNGAPSEKSITDCLTKLNAKHKRCDSFLWNNDKPWGPHSFFVIDGLYFEIGYRNIDDIKTRVVDYINGNVEPQHDCHDLGLGYMPSGLASSVAYEKSLIKCNAELLELKRIASMFPDELFVSLKKEYFDTAESLIDGKLISAANRNDAFFYEVISERITRCLMVMAFALGKEHFPGDKWNEKLLLRTNWANSKEFLKLLKEHILFNANTKEEYLEKSKILRKSFEIVKNDIRR
jgi:hypothetical protein